MPARSARDADVAEWMQRFEAIQTPADEIRFQADYVRDLIEATDYPMFDLERVVEIFLAWKADKKRDILRYRDEVYRSVLTGTLAAKHHTPWLEELDDSVERYLSTPEPDGEKSSLKAA